MDWSFDYLCPPMGGLTEGPVWNGRVVRFTQIWASRIWEYDPESHRFSVWREGVNRTNGLAYDDAGRLYGCCSGGRALLRFDDDGTDTVIADTFEGKRINTPNDLAIDSRGRIWFSDPWNAVNVDPDPPQALDHRSVLRADPQGDGTYTLTRVTFDTTMPNGVLLSPDENILYVAESHLALPYVRELRAYPIREDGSLGPYRLLHSFGNDGRGPMRGVDGMCLDADGNIVACCGWRKAGPGPMIYVFSPTGRILATHPTPCRQPTNCCFGGPDLTTLYVTSFDGHLLRARTDRRGLGLYP